MQNDIFMRGNNNFKSEKIQKEILHVSNMQDFLSISHSS